MAMNPSWWLRSRFLQLQVALSIQSGHCKRTCVVDFSTASCRGASGPQFCTLMSEQFDAVLPKAVKQENPEFDRPEAWRPFFLWARRAAPFRISSCFSHTFAGPLLPRKLQRSARGDAVAFAPAANGCRRGQLCFPPEFFEPQTSRFVVTWCPFPACLNASACQESGHQIRRPGGYFCR